MTTLITGNGLSPQNDLVQKTSIQSFRYTPFGEQQHTKTSGFTYNAEAFDAVTDMLNLRARCLETSLHRFFQRDVLQGNVWKPGSLYKYSYCINEPINQFDASGMMADTNGKSNRINLSALANIGLNVAKMATESIEATIRNATNTIEKLNMASKNGFDNYVSEKDPIVDAAYNKAKAEINRKKLHGEEYKNERDRIFSRACAVSALVIGNEYGKMEAMKLTEEQTIDTYEYALHYNYANNDMFRDNMNSRRRENSKLERIARGPTDPLCAGYIYDSFILKQYKGPKQNTWSVNSILI